MPEPPESNLSDPSDPINAADIDAEVNVNADSDPIKETDPMSRTRTAPITLIQAAQLTGASTATLTRYVANPAHSARISPFIVGEGKKRRYLPGVVEVFKEIKSVAKPGRPAGGGNEAASTGEAKPGDMPRRKVGKKPGRRPAATLPAFTPGDDLARSGGITSTHHHMTLTGRIEALELAVSELREKLG